MDKEKNLVPVPWYVAFEQVEPYVVKIITPGGTGTGYIVALTSDKKLIGIATAAHVIDFPHYWNQPIRIQHFKSDKTELFDHAERSIEINDTNDTASIVIPRRDFPIPDTTLPIIPEKQRLKIGVEAAWVGFPAIAPSNLCFFSGTISCWVEDGGFYFVDGVAINGVSGGPAFSTDNENKVVLIGIVSAYIPNRATGAQLPGLCVIRDVEPLQTMIKGLKSFEEAKKSEKQPDSPPPPAPTPASAEPRRS